MFNKILLILATVAFCSTFAHAQNSCKIAESIKYKDILGKKVASLLDKKIYQEQNGSQSFNFWTISKNDDISKKFWQDENIESIRLNSVQMRFEKNVRDRVQLISIEAPKIYKNKKLYAEYFNGCGPGDMKKHGIALSENICLREQHENISFILSDRYIFDEMFKVKKTLRTKNPCLPLQ